MPDSENLARAPIPAAGEANYAPDWMADYHDVIDSLLNLRAASEAERDTLFAAAPLGTEVTRTDGTVKWIKRPGGWSELWRQTVVAEVTPEWWSGGGASWSGTMRTVTSTSAVEIFVSAQYDGDNVTTDAGGNISPDLRVFRIPFNLRRANVYPQGQGYISGAAAYHSWRSDGDGWFFVARSQDSFTITAGFKFEFYWTQAR